MVSHVSSASAPDHAINSKKINSNKKTLNSQDVKTEPYYPGINIIAYPYNFRIRVHYRQKMQIL